MSDKKVKILIKKSGEVEISTEGFKGDECLKASEPYLNALGTVKERKLTEDFYEQPTRANHQSKVNQ